jgi:hypothetical protein
VQGKNKAQMVINIAERRRELSGKLSEVETNKTWADWKYAPSEECTDEKSPRSNGGRSSTFDSCHRSPDVRVRVSRRVIYTWFGSTVWAPTP